MFEVECPHCSGIVEILEINCSIFRHACYKADSKQVPPHTHKEECKRLVKEDLVYGCCKPFKIVNKKAYKCDYI